MKKYSSSIGVIITAFIIRVHIYIPYTAKHLRGKTFTFREENGYSLEQFHSSMLVDYRSLEKIHG